MLRIGLHAEETLPKLQFLCTSFFLLGLRIPHLVPDCFSRPGSRSAGQNNFEQACDLSWPLMPRRSGADLCPARPLVAHDVRG